MNTADRTELIALIEPLARKFFGEPNYDLSRTYSRPNELRFGTNGSLKIDVEKGTWYDFEDREGGGVLDLIKREMMFASARECFEWLEREGLWENNRKGKDKPDGTEEVVVDSFEYPGHDGVLSYAVDRIEFRKPDGSFVLNKDGKHKKTFRRKRPDPDKPGEWIPNVDGCPVLPYRLPELIEAVAAGHLIVVVEGEGKVNLLWSWNVPATCNSGGAGNWQKEHAEYLRGADVLVLGDADDVGRKFVETVGTSLEGIAKSIRVLDLPGLGPKEDILDWAKNGGTVEAFHALVAHQARPFRRAGAPQTMEALKTMIFAPIKYVVPGVIVEGLTILAGKPKIGKSWLLLHAACAVARGGFTLGDIHCIEGDVLYCALEDNQRRLQSRGTKLIGIVQDWPKRMQYLCLGQLPRLNAGGLDKLKAWIDAVPNPRLIVIDTFVAVRAPKKNNQPNYDADYESGKELHKLANERGLAIVIVHHQRKADADDAFDTVNATLGLTGVVDTVLVLKREASGNVVLYGRGRDLIEIEKAMAFDANACTWRIVGDAADIRRTKERSTVLEAIEEAGVPIGPSDIAAATGMKAQNVRFLLRKLSKEAVIEKERYGKYRAKGQRGERRPEAPAPSSAGTEAGAAVSVPFTLTAARKRDLRALGYSDEQIREMTPEQGQDILAQRRKLLGVLTAWYATIGIDQPRTVEQVIAAAMDNEGGRDLKRVLTAVADNADVDGSRLEEWLRSISGVEVDHLTLRSNGPDEKGTPEWTLILRVEPDKGSPSL
jgi:hypothetical protein